MHNCIDVLTQISAVQAALDKVARGLLDQHAQHCLYGHLMREYRDDPNALKRDLPHLDAGECEALGERIGWLTFEDIRSIVPGACQWLTEPA